MSVESWEVSDAFWEIVEPLIPKQKRDKEKHYKRIVGGGNHSVKKNWNYLWIISYSSL